MKCYVIQSDIESSYKLKDLLGKGTFGEVYAAERLSKANDSPKEVAVKIILIENLVDDQEAIENLAMEVTAHWQFSACGGMVSLLEIFEDGKNIYIIQELQKDGTLLDNMISSVKNSEIQIKFMMI